MNTADWYTHFADYEAAGSSPTYERISRAISKDDSMIELLDELPARKRQPNLLFAAARLAGAPVSDPDDFISFAESSWDEISTVMLLHSTQTNDAARTGTFLPLIAQIPAPIALIEVGCSAGLCLYPDRYGISYNDQPPLRADSPLRIDVTTTGPVPIPTALPEVIARIGIDLNPLDVNNPDDRQWLETLIWPEHDTRLDRLRAAMTIVAEDPPTLISGDLLDSIDQALDLVPDGATPVVFHSAVLNYIPAADRKQFADRLAGHPEVVWISNEGPGVIDEITTDLQPPPQASSAALFITVKNGTDVVGISDPHGAWIRW